MPRPYNQTMAYSSQHDRVADVLRAVIRGDVRGNFLDPQPATWWSELDAAIAIADWQINVFIDQCSIVSVTWASCGVGETYEFSGVGAKFDSFLSPSEIAAFCLRMGVMQCPDCSHVL